MQYSLPFAGAWPGVEIHRRLLAAYGPIPAWVPLDPVSQLVLSLLGSRTRDAVSMRVFDALRHRFGSWENLRDAPIGFIEPFLRPVTFAEKKVLWLPTALRLITAHRGALDLSFLADRPADAACDWLEKLPGVGPKVSASVANFSVLRMRMLVVDTHHLRVAERLNLLRPTADFRIARRRLMRQIPAEWTADDLDDHHTLMKWHGQRLCHKPKPYCGPCPLRDLCRHPGPAVGRPSGSCDQRSQIASAR